MFSTNICCQVAKSQCLVQIYVVRWLCCQVAKSQCLEQMYVARWLRVKLILLANL